MPTKKDKKKDRKLRQAARLYRQAEITLEEAAQLCGVKPSTLHKSMADGGEQLRPRGWTRKLTDADEKEILKLSRAGKTVAEIAEATGWASSTISRVRSRHGFERPKSRTRIYDADGELLKKRCPACDRLRLAKFWAMNAASSDGRQGYCKSCTKERRDAGRAA